MEVAASCSLSSAILSEVPAQRDYLLIQAKLLCLQTYYIWNVVIYL